jgi:Leucine-rich repeat (LRR) protein
LKRLQLIKATASELRFLQRLPQLEDLDICYSDITDSDLQYLKPLEGLVILNLDGNQITDGGLEYLKTLKQLRDLNLQNTKVTEEGVKKLLEALPNCEARLSNTARGMYFLPAGRKGGHH